MNVKTSARCRLLVMTTLFAIATGCGLSDYEQRMDAQRARIAEFDAVHSLLDDPIETPLIKLPKPKDPPPEGAPDEVPAWQFDLFLRLPKGYGAVPKDKTPYYPPFPFFRYSGSEAGANIFVAAALIAEPKTPEEFGKYYPENFRIFVRLAIADFYTKIYKGKIALSDNKFEARSVKPFGPQVLSEAEPIVFDFVRHTDASNKKISDPSVFDVYIHEDVDKQVCIVFHRPARAPNAELFSKSIEACLRTLDIGPEAGRKRTQFKKTR